MAHYYTCAETAKMVRKALSQAFAGIKFSVKSKTYAGGASINVAWQDGPCDALVDAVVQRFAGSFFDGMTDCKGSRLFLYQGKQVRFGADYINTARSYSDAQIERAIARVVRLHGWAFADAGLHGPLTAAGYRNAAYSGVELANGANVQRLIRATLFKMSDRLTAHSPLAFSLMHIASSGTGRHSEEGSGDHRAPTMLED